MANIDSSVAGSANFIPEAWAARALDVLRANIVLLDTVSRDVDWEPGWKGKVLHIPYPGRFDTVDKDESTPLTPLVPSGGTGVNLTLNHQTTVPFLITNFAQAVGQPQLMDRYITSATIAVAEAIESTIYTDANANFSLSSVGTYSTPIDASTVRAAKQALDDAKAPQANRYLVVNPANEIALLSDDDLKEYFAFSQAAQSGGQVANGRVGQLYGFDVRMSTLVPKTGSDTSNYAYQENAVLFASRPFTPAPPGSGVMQATAVDAESGLSIRLSVQYDINAVGVRANLDVLWGAVALRPDQGVEVRA